MMIPFFILFTSSTQNAGPLLLTLDDISEIENGLQILF